jgi:hypothetical protein
MHEIKFCFLSDRVHIFKEPWYLSVGSSAEALRSGRVIAASRIRILANSIRLLGIQVKGEPYARLNHRGRAGDSLRPWEMLNLRNDGYSTRKRLRGVPREIFGNNSHTPRGMESFRAFTRVLGQCGGVFSTDASNRPETTGAPEAGSRALWAR